MPVTYAIDHGIIRTKCQGFVTLENVLEHFQDLTNDPGCPRQLDVLLDLSETTAVPSSTELRVVADDIRRIRERVQFGACAILVSSDALHGTAMIFEVFAARSFRTSRIFRDAAEAEAWLAAERSRG